MVLEGPRVLCDVGLLFDRVLTFNQQKRVWHRFTKAWNNGGMRLFIPFLGLCRRDDISGDGSITVTQHVRNIGH